MSLPIFFNRKKKIKLQKFFPNLDTKKNLEIKNIKTLKSSSKNDLTFFDSIKYRQDAMKTKASYCLTTEKLKKFLPKNVKVIVVKNVLFEIAKILKVVYPLADIDIPDLSVKVANKKKFKSVKFGNNVLIGKNVKIGNNSIIGSNSIIEHNTLIGKNFFNFSVVRQ